MNFTSFNFSIIIVEDDPLISQDIKEILMQENFKVNGVFNSFDALKSADMDKIDLAFLDINLSSNETGIDVADFVKKKYNAHHIFITSYFDKVTVDKASKTLPLAYILKPYIDAEIITNLKLAIQKIKHQNSHNQQGTPIYIKTSLGLKKVNLEDIIFVEAYDMYTKIYTKTEKITSSYSLKQMEENLPQDLFTRIHRSYIINRNKIDVIKDNEIKMNEHSIPIGRSFKKSFFDTLIAY